MDKQGGTVGTYSNLKKTTIQIYTVRKVNLLVFFLGQFLDYKQKIWKET